MDAPLMDISALHGASLEVIQSSGSLVANTSSGFFSDPSLGSLQCNVSSAIYRSDSFGVASGASPSGIRCQDGSGGVIGYAAPIAMEFVDDTAENPYAPSGRSGGDIVASLVDEEGSASNYAPSSVGQYTVRGQGMPYATDNDGYTPHASTAGSTLQYHPQPHSHGHGHSHMGTIQHQHASHTSSGSSTPTGYGRASSASTNLPLPQPAQGGQEVCSTFTYPTQHHQFVAHQQHAPAPPTGPYTLPTQVPPPAADSAPYYGNYSNYPIIGGFNSLPLSPTPPPQPSSHGNWAGSLAYPYSLPSTVVFKGSESYHTVPNNQFESEASQWMRRNTATDNAGHGHINTSNDGRRPQSSRFSGGGWDNTKHRAGPHAAVYSRSTVSPFYDGGPSSGVYSTHANQRGGTYSNQSQGAMNSTHLQFNNYRAGRGRASSSAGNDVSNAHANVPAQAPKASPSATVSDSLPFIVGGFAFPGGLNRKERRRILFLTELDDDALSIAIRVPEGWAPGKGEAANTEGSKPSSSPGEGHEDGGGQKGTSGTDEKPHPQMRPYINISLDDYADLRRIANSP